MRYRPLGRTGLDVSILGFGASPLGGVFGEIDESEAIRSVHSAIDLGINLFDVSPYYGLTRAEFVLGRALESVPRDKFILGSKVGRYGTSEFDFSAARTARSVEESLSRLHVDTLDIVQCHDIEFGSIDQIVDETLPALEQLRRQGKVRFIGVTGLPLSIYPDVMSRASLDVILSYCHYTLFDTTLAEIIPALREPGVGILNASPLAMGLLTEAGPPGWHPAPPAMRAACADAARFCRERGSDIAKIALQFSLSEPRIASTLVGMPSAAQVEANARWADEPPDTSLTEPVRELLDPIRNQSWPSGRTDAGPAAARP